MALKGIKRTPYSILYLYIEPFFAQNSPRKISNYNTLCSDFLIPQRGCNNMQIVEENSDAFHIGVCSFRTKSSIGHPGQTRIGLCSLK